MNCVTLASALLEIEAILMLTRAAALQRDRSKFNGHLLEARAKLGELTAYVLTDGKEAISEIFLAASSDGEQETNTTTTKGM